MPVTSISALKRRQAVQVAGFLAAVAALTAGVFHLARPDLVAYRRGERALARGDFATAARDLGAAWAHGDRPPRLRVDLAQARLETGDRAGALALYEAALAEAPRDPALLDAVAGLYQAEKEPEKARRLLARLGPADRLPEAMLVRVAEIDEQAGDFAGASATFGLAAQRAPNDAMLPLREGIALMNAGRRDEALAAFRRALALDPSLRQAQLRLARTLFWEGRYTAAIDAYRHALPP